MGVSFSIIKMAGRLRSGPSVFSVVRNEMYFLPHFLNHYRNLGARDFLFLDDRSTDGSLDYLLAQRDCDVVQASLSFGESFGKKRFGIVARTLLPRKLRLDRWVLSVDADEFLILPSCYPNLAALAGAMEREGLRVARALMFDFFPASLRALEEADPLSDPFALCPFFDAWETVDWPDCAPHPARLSTGDGVRPRMLDRLRASSTALQGLTDTYRPASMYKMPLVRWGARTEMVTAHHVNILPSDRIQLGLAHFKFVPGYRARIADALASKAYWRDSMEYRFLEVAVRELQDWPLSGPRSRRFRSPADVEETGLIYSEISSAVAN